MQFKFINSMNVCSKYQNFIGFNYWSSYGTSQIRVGLWWYHAVLTWGETDTPYFKLD